MIQRKRHGRMRGPRKGHPPRPKSYKINCSSCGKEVVVQVLPPEGKRLLCVECFTK